jgi:hypothetical protein
MGAAWYVGRARWRRRWASLVVLGIVAGSVGGTVLAAAAGARRTSTAYDRLMTESDQPHEVLFVTDELPRVEQWLSENPMVERFLPAAGVIGRRAPQQDWYVIDAFHDQRPLSSAVLERGRVPDPDRANEVVITLRTAQNTGLDVGDTFVFNAYTSAQTERLLDDPWIKPAGPEIEARIVGVMRNPTDAQLSPTIKLMFGTPAFAEQYGKIAPTQLLAVWLRDGPTAGPEFQRQTAEFAREFPPDDPPFSNVSSLEDAEAADHAANAVVAGLAIFAVVAGLAGLVVVAQILRRFMARGDDEARVLAALGARRTDRAGALIISVMPYLAAAPIVAIVLAFAASALFPQGAVRALEPDPGLHIDPLAFAVGALAWLVILAALTALLAFATSAPARETTRKARSSARFASSHGNQAVLPFATGARFALASDGSRRSVRRAMLSGLIVAVAGVTGSALFAASLDQFTSSPRRYGLALDLTLELSRERAPEVIDALSANDDLTDVTLLRLGALELGGRRVDAYGAEPAKGRLDPILRDGRLPVTTAEIALGPKLLASLDRDVGDHVQVTTRAGPRSMRVVGSVFAPTPESTAFNGEAVVTPRAMTELATDPSVAVIARARPGAARQAFEEVDAQFPYAVSDESVPHAPGSVRNLEQITRLPLLLALFFALLGAAAMAQTLFTTAAARRRELAVLRSLGFTPRQASTVMGAAATTVAAVALLIGVPLGILIGRLGWNAVARSIYVIPAPVVPVLGVGAAVAAFVVFSNVVALVPAYREAHRPPAATLRAE